MKITSVRIQNLRAFKDETILFDGYTCFVGPNGAGKSTVLCALNIFFRDTSNSTIDVHKLHEEDFHRKDISEPVTITVTFEDLNEDAQKDFADYYRQGKLVVSAEARFDKETGCAIVQQFGQRLGMPQLRKYFEADKAGKKVEELRAVYEEIRAGFPKELPEAKTKPKMVEGLRALELAHPELHQLIPSQDEFYGFTRGANLLAKYVQWVCVPAVKDAATEQMEGKDTFLGKLLARTVRSKVDFASPLGELATQAREGYARLLQEHQTALDALSTSLQEHIADWAHPDASLKLEWQGDPEKAVRLDPPFAQIIAGEGSFSGCISRFGHGLQRSYLLALLQVLSKSGGEGGPRLLLGVEEPEIYQHPPQARHMARVLVDLSEKAQVIVCTHSPYFVSGQGFENVRLVRKDAKTSRASVSHLTFQNLGKIVAKARDEVPPKAEEGVLAKIHQALQPSLNEIFFTNRLVLVEGLEDVAYITAYMNLMGYDEDFRRHGCHIVPANAKSAMIKPLAIARSLCIPVFTVFDSDGDVTREDQREKHRKDNVALLRLCGNATPDPFPADHLWQPTVAMWNTKLGKAVGADFEPADWERYRNMVSVEYGQVEGLTKNSLYIADVLDKAWQDGKRSATLTKLCDSIRAFAEQKP